MKKTIKKFKHNSRRSYHEKVQPSQSNLSLTPSDMMRSAQDGFPIASALPSDLFFEGDESPAVQLDPLLARGIDVVDAWNLEQNSKKNLIRAKSKDIENYG